MHKNLLAPAFLALCIAGIAPTQANADITITGFSLTANTLTLSVTGTLPSLAPTTNRGALVLVNTGYSASSGFVFSTIPAFQQTVPDFTGSPKIGMSATGNQDFRDYVLALFVTPPTAGDSFNGTLTATWDSDVFHPENITDLSSLKLYWGTNANGDIDSGVFLAAVPEPSTVAMLSAGAAALLTVAIRRRRNKA